jgi:hypothetical protein
MHTRQRLPTARYPDNVGPDLTVDTIRLMTVAAKPAAAPRRRRL